MIVFLLACFGSDNVDVPGGQSGEEGAGCVAQATTALTREEVSPLGVSGDSLLAFADGTHVIQLDWASGEPSDGTVNVVTDPGTLAWVEYAYEDDGSGMEIAMDCADALEVDATVELASADGRLAEVFAVTLQAVDSAALSWFATLGLEDVAGSYDASEVDTSTYNDGVNVLFSGAFTADGSEGEVSGQGTGHEGEGDDGVAFAESFEIATWNPASE